MISYFPQLIPPVNFQQEAHKRLVQVFSAVREDGSQDVLMTGIFAATVRLTPSRQLARAICRASILETICPAPTDAGWAMALYDVVGAPLGHFWADDRAFVFTADPIEVPS